MKKTVSIFLVICMMLASVIAIIPASAASSDTEVVNLLPDGIIDNLENDLKSSTDHLHAFAPYAPYVYTNSAVNDRIANSKLLAIIIPVYKTTTADGSGYFYFTINVVKRDKLVNGNSDKRKYVIPINGAAYGLADNSDAFKIIEVDISSLNISVAGDETVVFFDNSDTLIPIWASKGRSANTAFYKTMEKALGFKGFAACAGLSKGYSENKDDYIVFDLKLEKTKADLTYYETERLMTEDVYNEIKSLYEGKKITTIDWAPSVAPFTHMNLDFQNRFAGTRLRTITLPVNKTLGVDSNGDLLFTIHTWKYDKLTSSDAGAKKSYTLKIKPADYGIEANSSNIFKFITIDLTSYNIVVAKDEVLSFAASSDTVIPGYGGVTSYCEENFPEMLGFGAYTGKAEFTSNTWSSSVIFFDITYDVPVSKSYQDLKKLYDEVNAYSEADFTSGWSAFKTALDAAEDKISKNEPTDDFTAEYNALKSANDALVANTSTDKSVLDDAISNAAKYSGKESQYTADTWKVFAAALDNANAVKAKTNALQSEINNAAAALNDAMGALIEKGAIGTLESKVGEINGKYNSDDYTVTSYKKLTDALNAANALIKKGYGTNDEVSNALTALDDAVAGLAKRADFTKMNELVAKYEGVTENEYHPDSLTALMEAIDDIKQARKPANAPKTSEADGAELLKALEAAIAGLKAYADFDDIDDKLASIEQLKKSDYTEASWNALEGVKTKIAELKKDKYALNEDAVALLAELNAAVDGLVKADDTAGEGTATPADDGENETEAITADDDSDNDAKQENKGCGSAIGTTVVAMTAILALGGATLLKRKEN